MSTERKTGGSNDYYRAEVTNTLDGRPAYDVQCLEVIETLGMTFAEGEAFKAIWRSCAARTLGKHKADNNALYDAEKVEFYGKRMVAAAKPVSGANAEEKSEYPRWATHLAKPPLGAKVYVRAVQGSEGVYESLDCTGKRVETYDIDSCDWIERLDPDE